MLMGVMRCLTDINELQNTITARLLPEGLALLRGRSKQLPQLADVEGCVVKPRV